MEPHRTDGVFAAKEDAVEIRAVHCLPVRQRGVLRVMPHCTRLEAGDACVIHHDVKSPALLQDLRGSAVPLVFRSHVQRKVACRISERVRKAGTKFIVDVGDINEASSLGKRSRNRCANPLRSARDQCDLGSESRVHK